MTPQELMDMDGAGRAASKLRDMGMWRMCINDTERIEWLDAQSVTVATENDMHTFFNDVVGDYWDGGIRWHIDVAADTEYANEEETE